MKYIASLLILGILSASNLTFSQGIKSKTNEPTEKKFQPYLGVGLFPIPTYIGITGGIEIGNANSNSVYSSIYAKVGNFGIENTFHSYFVEVNFKLKTLDFQNNSSLTIETPIWLGNRNIIETFVEERHEQHDYTYLQAGFSLNIKYSISKKLKFFSKIGIGYGPQYSYAGDFNFTNYHFEKYTWLALADVGIRFNLF